MTPRLVILDLDGTVHRDGEQTLGAADVVSTLIRMGVSVRYLTNNSTVDPASKVAELAAMGVPATQEWIKTPGPYAARLLKKSDCRSVFVVGEPPLHKAIVDGGLYLASDLECFNAAVDGVVVGLMRNATFSHLRAAARAINDGAIFVATNTDKTFPVDNGKFDPGAGAIVAFLQTATGVDPIVVGKPSPKMVLETMIECGVEPSETLVVGDRLDTDIAAGLAAGTSTWLVLTGVESEIPEGQPGSEDLRGILSLWN